MSGFSGAGSRASARNLGLPDSYVAAEFLRPTRPHAAFPQLEAYEGCGGLQKSEFVGLWSL